MWDGVILVQTQWFPFLGVQGSLEEQARDCKVWLSDIELGHRGRQGPGVASSMGGGGDRDPREAGTRAAASRASCVLQQLWASGQPLPSFHKRNHHTSLGLSRGITLIMWCQTTVGAWSVLNVGEAAKQKVQHKGAWVRLQPRFLSKHFPNEQLTWGRALHPSTL